MNLAISGSPEQTIASRKEECQQLQKEVLGNRSLIIAANRGPVSFELDEQGQLLSKRRGGGLVTALTGLAQHVDATWIAAATTEGDFQWQEGDVELGENGESIRVKFVTPDPAAYDKYYNQISNPLLWFLQHNMWNIAYNPTFDRDTWRAWDDGYVVVNDLFAEAIAQQILANKSPSLVMLQDYQLYLVPSLLRKRMRRYRKPGKKPRYTISHFVHIPWPGEEDWGFLPPAIRRQILESLCAVDLLGFQTRDDGLNFIRSVESHLPGAHTNFRRGRIWYRNHATYIRDFPISIDVDALRQMAESEGVEMYREQLEMIMDGRQVIVRVDRTEPSKNIVRGFEAFEELIENHPEHIGRVVFLALMAPSRLDVEEYQFYLDKLMAAAGRVNAKHGTSQWEPIRVLVGNNYPRAVAALQLYDVLLVNSIADGMNLVAKEGPIVNQRDGAVILSERTGARQQLAPGSIVIAPSDVYATAEAMHQALTMEADIRHERAARLKWIVEREDITDWLCRQLEALEELDL